MRIQQFDFSNNVLDSIIWQYDNASKITGLLQYKNTWLTENHTAFWQNWYTDIFNLDTANDFGLAVWSIILGLPLFIELNPESPTKPFWAFENRKNFDHGVFSNATDNGGIPILTTEQKRIVLKLYYYKLCSRCATYGSYGIPNTNMFLNAIFKDYGRFYVLDGLDMTITYVIGFNIDPNLLQVLKDYDILPRAAAVGIKRYVILTRPVWGFGPYNKNFDNGNFGDD